MVRAAGEGLAPQHHPYIMGAGVEGAIVDIEGTVTTTT